MFYVYDLDGLRFRGPMEALERERRVERRAPVPPLKRGGRTTPFAKEETPAPPGNPAIAAYLQTINRESMVEQLVHIYQIMSDPVSTIDGEMALLEAWQTLGRAGIRQLVVISERNQVIGMLSDRDILKRINVIDDEVEVDVALRVADVMQREVITTDAMSDIRRVARVMAFYHVEAIPVTRDDGRLVGIVTRGDILRNFAENPRLNLWA